MFAPLTKFTLSVFLNCLLCRASFLLDINSEMNPIHDCPNKDLPNENTNNFAIPKTIVQTMGIQYVQQQQQQQRQSADELKKWMSRRLHTGNKHLLLKIAKTFKQARLNKTLPRNILRKLNAKPPRTFQKMVTVGKFKVEIDERNFKISYHNRDAE